SHYGFEPYRGHFVIMHRCAVDLAKKLGANLEVVELAAWIHDIGSIIQGRENHHQASVEIAEKKLRELDYPEKKIEEVKHCIFAHRSSEDIPKETIEAKIISDADAISNFGNIVGILKAALVYENQNQFEARKSTLEKLQRKWKKLELEESRRLIKPKYEAAVLLLSDDGQTEL
ncbi:HD domain-containing protein, partial [Candidatus Pacearchaeota archaeon]|nr:HD domain-containing protein [Candidatus Pacearchaeota archaeon]